MTTITIPKKEYSYLKHNQEKISAELSLLKSVVLEFAGRELHPSVIKKLERQSKLLDRGVGKSFSNVRDFKRYLRTL